MIFDRFLIAPFRSGLQNNLRPWLIPEDAFEFLENAYVFRGSVRKRFGTTWMGTTQLESRLRINLGNTDGSGNITGTAPGSVFKIGQMFSVGAEIYTVNATGTPANMLINGSATVATFNTTSGAYVVNGAPAATPLYFYPSEPVMGFTLYETGAVNNHPIYAFDTQFSYTFSGGAWSRIGTTVWHGSNSDFFSSANWIGNTTDIRALFVSNFYVTNPSGATTANDDPIYYTINGSTWNAFSPNFIGSTPGQDAIKTARIIVPFKNRLVLINTIELDTAGTGNVSFPNRCRFSQNGSPLATGAFLEPNQTGYLGGGYIDAPTDEAAVSAEFIKDRLIVYFERSTWELVYTGNEVLPFVWQQINTELGAQSTFSIVPFDKNTLAIGETGVHACNGANVVRIDEKIPDQIFQVRKANDGIKRIAGIRDYYTEMVYWTFPLDNMGSNGNVFPNRMLIYNYQNQSWSLNEDCYTAMGYYEQASGVTWQSSTTTWAQSAFAWASGITQANFRNIVAGNQQGYVVTINSDVAVNACNMQVTAASVSGNNLTLTIIDHTLAETTDFIYLNDLGGMTNVNGLIYQVDTVVDDDTVIVTRPNFAGSGTYTGGGVAGRVSRIGIASKQWNPYIDKGRNVYLAKIDFAVQPTSAGSITVDYSPSSTRISLVNDGTANGSILGNNILETSPYPTIPLESLQNRLWHPVYFQAEGECIQLSLYFSDSQMFDKNVSMSDFVLEGMILYTKATTHDLG